ncbi:MAG: hypothetical protein IPM38_09720 [Ignavibacteria bacterium]|nr:hypothetical protein [Ignavibacteria bacterium]
MEMIKSQVQRLKTWEPYIMSFDNANRSTYILRLERSSLIEETFFNDVLSYEPIPSDYMIASQIPEAVSERYLQVGKFNNPDEMYSRYFMIVNRRCSPIDTSDPGGVNGRRSVTIKLDSASTHFAGFNNWSIYDLERDSLIITFDKRIISTTNLGWFNPAKANSISSRLSCRKAGRSLLMKKWVEILTAKVKLIIMDMKSEYYPELQ